MNYDLTKALNLLKNVGYTCVLCRKDIVYCCVGRGVKPLLDFIDNGTDLNGFSAADKVVGNAAAFLYVILGVKEVYAQVISKSAAHTLEQHGVKVYRDKSAEYIVNRTGTGRCPMEEAVADISEPTAALTAIRKRLKELKTAK